METDTMLMEECDESEDERESDEQSEYEDDSR